GGYHGEICDFRYMCSDEQLNTRDTAPVRISVTTKAEADFLLTQGALLFGTRCRVTLYKKDHKAQ
ncbi:hypothetical protein R3P38DRAFT_2566082, partial [Favolaschia claudopus]